ncbi:MAG: hypothetical protein H7274_18735 [Rhodoferax sp.]|nr:hypothetical protein [Rhodoferax sp.]
MGPFPRDASPLWRDIASQPLLAVRFSERIAEFVALGARLLAPGPGGRLWVCGCGDGLFAAQSVAGYAQALGLDWRPIGALDLLLCANGLRPQDRVVAISMSGNVDRTVEAARAVAAVKVPMLALVNGDGGLLGGIASDKISLGHVDIAPFLCGTGSYSLTMLALAALATGAAGKLALPALAPVIAAQEHALLVSEAAFGALAVPTGVRFLSAGQERGSCAYAAAKLVELTRIPAWSADLEEFAHSQYWSMPATDLVVVIATTPVLARRAGESCSALRELGVTTLAIDMVGAEVSDATCRVTLPAVPAVLAPLATAVPLQLLAATMARASGLDPDTRRHLKEDTLRFRVSRLLTRRSLLGTGQ